MVSDDIVDVRNTCNGTFLYNNIVVSTYVISFKEYPGYIQDITRNILTTDFYHMS